MPSHVKCLLRKKDNMKKYSESRRRTVRLKFQRDVRSILVQDSGIVSYGEAVKWKFEGIDLEKWFKKTYSRQKEYMCERSLRIGKT